LPKLKIGHGTLYVAEQTSLGPSLSFSDWQSL